jgi:hypothetical protein
MLAATDLNPNNHTQLWDGPAGWEDLRPQICADCMDLIK